MFHSQVHNVCVHSAVPDDKNSAHNNNHLCLCKMWTLTYIHKNFVTNGLFLSNLCDEFSFFFCSSDTWHADYSQYKEQTNRTKSNMFLINSFTTFATYTLTAALNTNIEQSTWIKITNLNFLAGTKGTTPETTGSGELVGLRL